MCDRDTQKMLRNMPPSRNESSGFHKIGNRCRFSDDDASDGKRPVCIREMLRLGLRMVSLIVTLSILCGRPCSRIGLA